MAPKEVSPGRQLQKRPDADYSFTVEFEGVPVQGVVEVSGLKMEVDVIEVRQQNAEGTTTIRKLPGQRKGGELVLTRPLTGDSGLRDWMVAVQGGGSGPTGAAQRDGTVVVFAGDGNPLQSYTGERGLAQEPGGQQPQVRRQWGGDGSDRSRLRAARPPLIRARRAAQCVDSSTGDTNPAYSFPESGAPTRRAP